MNMFRASLIMLISFMVIVNVYAGRSITLPFEIYFTQNNYSDIVRITGTGGSHVNEPSGGWNGSGAAKFYPPTSSDTYCGLGWFDGFGDQTTRQLNVRVLVYFGDQMASTANREDKFIIFNRNSGNAGDRVMTVIDDYNGEWITFSAAINAASHWYPYQPGDSPVWYPNEQETFRIGDNGSREEEWICIELEASLGEEIVRTIITTQDGQFNEEVHVSRTITSTGGFWDSIDMIGGYWNDWGGTGDEPGRYIKLSHLKIDDQHIGPPPGFVGGNAGPPQPTGIRIKH